MLRRFLAWLAHRHTWVYNLGGKVRWCDVCDCREVLVSHPSMTGKPLECWEPDTWEGRR